MTEQDYHASITVPNNIEAAFDSIKSKVGEWWTPNLTGSSDQTNNEFSVHFGETMVQFKVMEVTPDEKIVWLVTDCYLHWLKDKEEWTGTSLIFELKPVANAVEISLTHLGLKPGIECYESCVKGWDFFFGKSLYQLLTTGTGMPDMGKAGRD